ncbi:GatB/YqeY domain-containing protein [Candidatus Wolfebacteria bacterium]|nr:GatB/YqeY domain-containing protein [Candidatus Wolfebacteria bacterium]
MLQQAINSDIKEFLKAGKSFEAGILRLMISAFKNKEIEKRGKGEEGALTDEEIIEILSKESKKRKETSEVYLQNNRPELAEQELKELEMIKKYLPAQLSREEVGKIVDKAIKDSGAMGVKDMGKTIKAAMIELKGRADASMVSELIKQKLV